MNKRKGYSEEVLEGKYKRLIVHFMKNRQWGLAGRSCTVTGDSSLESPTAVHQSHQIKKVSENR
jgi:hypothetical protein